MELPNARIVKQAGVVVAPPRVPLRKRLPKVDVRGGLRDFVGVALGLWPLTAVLLLFLAMMIAVGANASVKP